MPSKKLHFRSLSTAFQEVAQSNIAAKTPAVVTIKHSDGSCLNGTLELSAGTQKELDSAVLFVTNHIVFGRSFLPKD